MNEFVQNFHFLRPIWLAAIFPVIAIWWFLFRGQDAGSGLADDIAPHLLKHLVSTPENRPRIRPATMLLPMTVIAIVCLAGPTFRRQPSPFAEDRSHLMLVIRVTPSMLRSDVQPSRLERVRTKINELLARREGADAGLIAYSGSAHLVMPPTRDREIIDHMLQAIDPAVMPSEGDVLAEALALAARESNRRPSAGSILIVADGADRGQPSRLRAWREKNPMTIQWFAPLRDNATVNRSGIREAADALGISPQLLTSDQEDIVKLAKRADRAIVSGSSGEAAQWRDEGYTLLGFLLLGTLLWCRRGWSVSDEG